MRKVLLVLTLTALATLTALPAGAIVDGVPDGDGHPMVGAVVGEFDGVKDWFCSGTLIAPKVFLTAGHCTEVFDAYGLEDAWVTFDPVFDADASKFWHGTWITHPAYSPNTLANDVGLIILDKAVKKVTPATLPTLKLLDQMKRDGTIDDELYKNVGYGGTAEFTGGPPTVTYDGIRRVSYSPYGSLTQGNLHLQSNSNEPDTGGTCFGDSGGPHFYGDSLLLVSVTSWGDAICRSNDMTQRVDIRSVQDFLDDYVTLS